MPDLRELVDDAEEAAITDQEGLRKRIWTALPVVVERDSDGHVVTLRSTVKAQVRTPDGKVKHVDYPLFSEVPVHFPGGGGVTVTHPVKAGDEGIVIFMARAQDAWFQSGGVQQAVDSRMHSLSDGRYIPGGRSKPRKLSSVSTTSTQIRSDDGSQVIDLHPTAGVTITTNQKVVLNAPVTEMTTTLKVTGDIELNDISLKDHVHGGILPGGADTTGPHD